MYGTIDLKLLRSSEGTDFVSPLYIYMPSLNSSGSLLEGRYINYKDEFMTFINNIYSFEFTPTQILAYIYAVTHSTIYLNKYSEFLRIDFPRIPFTIDRDLFIKLSSIGQELIEHHLMRKSYSQNICQINGINNNYKVEHVTKDGDNVYINKDRYFSPITEDIWNYSIGGYKVLSNWLEERQDNGLEVDVKQFIHIANIIDRSLKLTKTINELTDTWI